VSGKTHAKARARRLIVWPLLIFFSAAASVMPAAAGPGVRLSLGEVRIDQLLFVGTSYDLPSMIVSNPGDVVASYVMSLVEKDSEQLTIPEQWVALTPSVFELAPGETQTVEADLEIPQDARLGMYEGFLAAQLTSNDISGSGTGARLGAGAAATLSFEVGARTLIEAWASSAAAFWQDAGIWAYMATGGLALAVLVVWFRRRFSIQIVAR
jgi:hypothetical protein